MLLDLLSTDNYVNFNIKLAEILGLHTAIYTQELLNIYEKAVRKNKVEDDCFKIDRSYIQKRTTLSSDEQKELDVILESIGIATYIDNKIKLNLNVLTSLVAADASTVSDITVKLKKVTKSSKKTKAQVMKDNLKTNIKVPSTEQELYNMYCSWIDAVCDKKGWMNAITVTEGQRLVNDFCKGNWSVALRIVTIGASNGWSDLQWAINKYNQECSTQSASYRIVQNNSALAYKPEVELSEVVF